MNSEDTVQYLRNLRDRIHQLHQQPTVLVVEDNPVERSLIVDALQTLRFLVTSVGNGLEAMHQLDTVRFDLVFLDLRLPTGPDGLEVLRRTASRSKFIVVTGSDENAAEVLEAMQLGAMRFLLKPITVGKLQSLLN